MDKEIDLKEFGLKLSRRRLEKNISAYALSRELNKNKNYISRIEAGANVSMIAFLEICQALDIDPKEMF